MTCGPDLNNPHKWQPDGRPPAVVKMAGGTWTVLRWDWVTPVDGIEFESEEAAVRAHDLISYRRVADGEESIIGPPAG